MRSQKIFSRVFEEALDTLLWTETKRHGPQEFYGMKTDALRDHTFGVQHGLEQISQAIADAFHYMLQNSEMRGGFGQNYYNCEPLATYQYLSFNMVKQRDPRKTYDNPLAGTEGFEFLTESCITFYRGRYGMPQTEIELESQNMGLYQQRGWGRENTFTKRGHAMMGDLLSQKGNILRVAGMCDHDHRQLEEFLDLIEQKYANSELIPRSVSHT